MLNLSVITCTHNPRSDYLLAAVEALASQTLPSSQWEYLLIDNASEVGLIPAVDISWHPNGKFIREGTLGLTAARLRGIREAQGNVLVFVDDDNVLDTDFLERAMEVAREKPFLGSWSGQCRPRFDEAPPEWTQRYWGSLVIREFNTDVWSNLARLPQTMPCGAGLCVRRSVALHYLGLHESGLRRFHLDRTGCSLLSGGDNDLAGCACDMGMGVGLISALKLTHLIPAERLSVDYLSRLSEGIYFSAALLDYFRTGQIKSRSFRVRVSDLLRLCLLKQPHRKIYAASILGRQKALNWLRKPDVHPVILNL